MKKLLKKRRRRSRKRVGEAPGSVIYIGEERARPTSICFVRYSKDFYGERAVGTWEEVKIEDDHHCWIHLDGIHEVQKITALERKFGVHPLALEDAVNTLQRPRLESYQSAIHVVLKHWSPPKEGERDFVMEQVSLFLGKGFVVSLQEDNQQLFQPVFERLREGRGIIRSAGPDYLLYALVDLIVDSYFSIVDHFNDEIDEIETRLRDGFDSSLLHEMYLLKRNLLQFRKSLAPAREVVSGLQRSQAEFMQERTRIYLGDVYDHLLEVLESLDTSRDIMSLMIDYYLSLVNTKTNEVARVLTIMTAIFAPPTLLSGIYGMNVDTLPGLGSPGVVWLILGGIFLMMTGMISYFRFKRWF